MHIVVFFMVIRFVRSCMMFCLPLYLLPGYLLRFSTFPNILIGVGCTVCPKKKATL
jgi:hypothetical protein